MYTFDSRIRYSETDSEGKLNMASLVNYFQDVTTFQSEDIGMGVEELKSRHLVWVLSAWQIVVERYPDYCEHVTVGTKPYDMKGFLGYRNFCLMDDKGEYLAKGNSLWSLINTDTGRPVPVPEDILAAYPLEEKLEMDYAPRRIDVPKEGSTPEALVVKKHHLDTNKHVNNQQFISMAMDYLPEDFRVGQVRAEYKRQAFLDDVLIPFVGNEGERIVVVLADEGGAPYVVVEFLQRGSAANF